MIKILSARHTYPEKNGLLIDRKNGYGEYTFLHFYNSMRIVLNGKEIITEPHAVIIYNKTTPQFFESKKAIVHDWLHFTGEADSVLFENEIEFDKIYYPKQFDFITKITSELEKETFSEGFRTNEFINLKFHELILKLNRALYQQNEYVEKDIRDKFRTLRGEMFSSLGNKWTVQKMAANVNLSQSRFYKVYKTIFGVSPTADLIDAKIGSAKNMLLNTNKKVEEIATELGYDNTSHFIRQFKATVGVTPTSYKRGRY